MKVDVASGGRENFNSKQQHAHQNSDLKLPVKQSKMSTFPGSSMVERSAVNRNVGSSNLPRGATSLWPPALTQFAQSLSALESLPLILAARF